MKTRHVYRSAKTGRFVSAEYAKRHPKTTVRERVTSRAFTAFVNGCRV